MCAHKIATRRADELRRLLDQHRAHGGAAYLLTLTLPHDAGDRLRPMRRHVARAWQYIQTGAPWKRMKERIGFVGSVRALEVTVGRNGWHPHLHVLVLTEAPLNAGLRVDLCDFAYRRWSDAITRSNQDNGQRYRKPDRYHGVTLTESHRDTYLTKLGLADEIVMGGTKLGRGFGHRAPLQILADIAAADAANERDVELWREYATEMHGARQLTWSKGLRERYSIEDTNDHDLCAEPEVSPAASLVFTIGAADWDQYVARDVKLQLDILEAARGSPDDREIADAIARLIQRAKGSR